MTTTVSITWWGHATTTIDVSGRRFLTDPVLTRRVAHLSRIGAPIPGRDALRADVVLVSHLHRDHLHAPSLQMLDPRVRIVAPYGAARALRRAAPKISRRIEEIGPGGTIDLGEVCLRAVPAEHDGRRSPWSRDGGPALGFVLEADGFDGFDGFDDPERIWFAGDTGLFDAMRALGPVDIAVVPIGGWGPSLSPTHLDPAQAAEAVRRVGARHAIPIHYGTFWPTGLRHLQPASFQRWFTDPAVTFTDQLATRCPCAQAHVIAHGQTVRIPGRSDG